MQVPSSLIIHTLGSRAIMVDMSSPDLDVTPIQNMSHCLTISRLHFSMPFSSPPCTPSLRDMTVSPPPGMREKLLHSHKQPVPAINRHKVQDV